MRTSKPSLRSSISGLLTLVLVVTSFGLAESVSAAERHHAAGSVALPALTQVIHGRHVHFDPAPAVAAVYRRQAGVNPNVATNMTYHGGRVMLTQKSYAIYWAPPTLQDGTPTDWGAGYTDLIDQYFSDVGGNGLYQNNTQYYEHNARHKKTGGRRYIANDSTFGGAYFDTHPYPVRGHAVCGDVYPAYSVNLGNCISDLDVRAEVVHAISVNGWTVDRSSEFFVFTAPGEGSCYGSGHPVCAYDIYCAFHSAVWNPIAPGMPIIYANMPWADPTRCASGSQAAPNSGINPAADYAISITAHEQIEAVTDPLGTGWYSQGYNEIGDKCAYNFGTNGFDGGLANEFWNGHPYEIQQMWDNQTSSCVQSGP